MPPVADYSRQGRQFLTGAVAAEVYCYINGTPPTDPTECQLVAVSKKSVVRVNFTGAQAGKNAHFMARWVNSRGEKGPWSETSSATIGA